MTDRAELRAFLDKLLSHEGKCEFGEQLARGEITPDALRAQVPRKIRSLVERHFETVEVFAKNPCYMCATYQLEKDYVGSGFCSAVCYEEHEEEQESFRLCAASDDPVDMDDLFRALEEPAKTFMKGVLEDLEKGTLGKVDET